MSVLVESNQIQSGDYFKILNVYGKPDYYLIESITFNDKWIQIDGHGVLIPDDLKTIFINIDTGKKYLTGVNDSKYIEFLESNQISSREVFLTGVQEIDLTILLQLDDISLTNVCQIDTYVKDLCQDENLWRIRSEKYFSSRLNEINPNISYRQNYINFVRYPSPYQGNTNSFNFDIFNKATQDDNLEYIQFILDLYPDLQVFMGNIPKIALESGSIDILDWLLTIDQGGLLFLDNPEVVKIVISSDNADSYRWLKENNIIPGLNDNLLTDALKYGSLNILRYMEETESDKFYQLINDDWYTTSLFFSTRFYSASKGTNVELIQYLLMLRPKIFINRGILSHNVSECHVDMAKFWYTYSRRSDVKMKPLLPSKQSLVDAAGRGCLEILQFLAEQDPPILPDVTGANAALANGYLDVLKLLSEYGIFPTSLRAMTKPAVINNPDLLYWIFRNRNLSDQMRKRAGELIESLSG